MQLGDRPIPPEDKSKHPKGYVPKKPEEDPDWIEYVYVLFLSLHVRQSMCMGMLHVNIINIDVLKLMA